MGTKKALNLTYGESLDRVVELKEAFTAGSLTLPDRYRACADLMEISYKHPHIVVDVIRTLAAMDFDEKGRCIGDSSLGQVGHVAASALWKQGRSDEAWAKQVLGETLDVMRVVGKHRKDSALDAAQKFYGQINGWCSSVLPEAKLEIETCIADIRLFKGGNVANNPRDNDGMNL